jgi:hypothetical protein
MNLTQLYSRDELYKRRRGFGATGQPLQDEMDVGGAVDDNIDFEKYTIQDAINYQKTSGIALQQFTDGIANKMKFQVSNLNSKYFQLGFRL